MRRVFLVLLIFTIGLVSWGQKKALIKNKYILRANDAGTGITWTAAADTVAWLENGYGLIRVVYKPGGYDPKAGKTKPLSDDFFYHSDKDGNRIAWGIIDETGKFLLEPVYYEIDLWSNLVGIAYRLERSQERCGFLYPTYVNLNKKFVRYLGFDTDDARMIGTNFIILKNLNKEIGLYDSDFNVLEDTVKSGYVGYGTPETLQEYTSSPRCDVPKTLQNLKNTSNPKYVVFNSYDKDCVVYGADKSKILPEGQYAFMRFENGVFKGRRSGGTYDLLIGTDLKPLSEEHPGISFNKNGYWIFDDRDGKYSFAAADGSALHPDSARKLQMQYADEYNRKLEEDKAAYNAMYSNPDLVGYLIGDYARFRVKYGSEEYTYTKYDGDRMKVSRVGNSQNKIFISINAETFKTELINIITTTFNQALEFNIYQDSADMMIIHIGDQSAGGWYNKKTKEIYLTGYTSNGVKIEIFSANYNF